MNASATDFTKGPIRKSLVLFAIPLLLSNLFQQLYNAADSVIVGNFGLPSWSERFYKFLDKTDLEVKNRIILSDGTAYFNPLSSPSLNLLGYKALGVKNIDFLPKEDNSGYPILFELRL